MARQAELRIDLPVPTDLAFDAVCHATISLGFALTSTDRFAGIVTAASAPAMVRSWGETLDLFIQPDAAGTSTVIARATTKDGPYDWGRNPRNAADLSQAIHQQVTIVAAAAHAAAGAAAGSAVPAAGWHPDPSGRYQHRWWDGTDWTSAVTTDGVTTVDPLPPPA
jgi:hypothetical protein